MHRGASSSGDGFEGGRCRVRPWQRIIEAALWVTLDDAGSCARPHSSRSRCVCRRETGPTSPSGSGRSGSPQPDCSCGQETGLLPQPRLQRPDHRPASFPTVRAPLLGGATADLGLDPAERGDAGERLRRDQRGGSEVIELPTHMAPTAGQPHRTALGRRLVGRIAVDLQHACEPGEMRDGTFGRAQAVRLAITSRPTSAGRAGVSRLLWIGLRSSGY